MPRRARTSQQQHRVALALLALAALIASGCGARWSDEQAAELASRGQGTGSSTDGGLGVIGSGGATDGTDGGEATATTVGGSTTGGGTSGGTTGGTGGTGGSGGGAKPCAAASKAPGVTDDKITIASLASLSGPVPGIGASAAAATRAYVAYRNSTGGVCGRQIVLKEADDGTDNGRYRAIVSDLAPSIFGIAGGFAIADVGGIDVLRQEKIPLVSVTSSDPVSEVPNVYDINPRYPNLRAQIGKYKYLYAQGSRKVSMVYLAVDQSRAEARNQRSLMEAAGLQIVQTQELPLSTLSYDSPARGVGNSGADYLFFIGDLHGNASMAKAIKENDVKLKFAEYFAYGYATEFVKLAGDASEGAMTWMRTRPVEEANINPEVAAFVQWMDRVAPGADLDPFAADAWAGTKAFFDILETVPGPISRELFVTTMGKVQTYDAGGLLAPIRFGQKVTNGCVVGMHVVKGKWVRLTPARDFLC